MISEEERNKALEEFKKLPREEQVKKAIEMTLVVQKLKSERYKKHLYEFNRDIMGWPDLYEPLHKKVCDFIQDNIEKKMILILIPRGCFKSSVVTVGLSAWEIAKDNTTRGLIANATYPMATQFLGQVEDVLQKNEKFIELYGDLATDAPIWREDAFAVNTPTSYQSKEATVTALGIGSNYTGKHFDWAILDDLVNRDNIRTIDRIEEVINFYKDVLDLVDPSPKTGHKKVIVVGTCWEDTDLYAWIQDQDTGILQDFAILKLPAYGSFVRKGGKDVFDGEWGVSPLLFPTRLTWGVLEGLKRNQGLSHFSGQYLLDPVPPENAEFRNFKYYEKDDLKGMVLTKFVSLDPAFGEKNENDFSAMICVGVDKNNTWYILDIWRDKVPPQKLIEKIFEWDFIHKPYTFAVESTAFQRILQFYIRDEMKKRGHYVPIKEVAHTTRSKEDRIRSLQPFYERGSVYHDSHHPLTKYLEDELKRFPHAKNDDIADALATINEIGFTPQKREVRSSIGRAGGYPA